MTNLTAGQGKALATSHGAWPQKRVGENVKRVLGDRMTISEAVEAVGHILDGYPNGGRDSTKGYIGALAQTLASYPRQVAMKCADTDQGIVKICRFLPTVADVVAWCEKETEPLYRRAEHEDRTVEQVSDRALPRPPKLTIEQLKEKYGDWHDDWRPLGAKAQEAYEKARDSLIGQIGEQAFHALPDAE